MFCRARPVFVRLAAPPSTSAAANAPHKPPLPAVALKPDLFEGLRFEINRPLNQNFFLTHRCAERVDDEAALRLALQRLATAARRTVDALLLSACRCRCPLRAGRLAR